MVLDPLLHQPSRSLIMSLLITHESLSFKQMKERLELTDGNLSTHLRKLEEAECITLKKIFENRKPKSIYQITDHGRQRFEAYLETLKQLIEGELTAPNQ